MRKGLKIILTGLSAIALTSCAEEMPQSGPGGGIPLRIVPRIVETSADGATRGVRIKGTEFTVPVKLGLGFTPRSATSTIDGDRYKNFWAQNYPGPNPRWQYVVKDPDNNNEEANAGYILGYSDWGTIDVVGYHPYDPNATDLSAIPFRLVSPLPSGELEGRRSTAFVDYMVADPVVRDMRQGGDFPLYLSFHHTMTAIEFRLIRGTTGYSQRIQLGHVTLEIEGGREFVVAGTYNAVDGADGDAINAAGRETATKMTIRAPAQSAVIDGQTTTTIPLVIMPELRYSPSTSGLGDATVKITFYFLDSMGNPYLLAQDGNPFGPKGNPEVSFKLSDVLNSGNDSGLLRGWCYAVTADIVVNLSRSAASEQPAISLKVAPTLSATPM